MRRCSLLRNLLAVSATLLVVAGCTVPVRDGGQATGFSVPPPAQREPARIGLPRIHRPFVDALEGTGDWVLIEPFGWVFRPDVNTVAWRPYRDGWWEPSDVYGWIWNSQDEFGWITDHYGAWFHDRYQGWVWQPGAVWGPAWVAWVATEAEIGWAPLAPDGYRGWDEIPGGPFLFARAQQFDLANGGMQAMFARELPPSAGAWTPVGGEVVVEGKRLVLGPSLERIRKMGGMARLRDQQEPRRFAVESSTQVPALEARLRAAFDAGVREANSRRPIEVGTPSPSAPAPRLKPAVAPLGGPRSTGAPPADSSLGRRIKPARAPSASPDTLQR